MDIDLVRNFREKIKTRPVFGPFTKTPDPDIIEVLGYSGFDFVILDMEHGQNHIETTLHLIRAAEIANIIPIVRVQAGDFEMIPKVLDMGAAGVQVPQINNAQDVEHAVKAARFAPLGARGVSTFVRGAKYSAMKKSDFFSQSNEALLLIQIEGQEALDNLDEILSVKGMDIVFIGPYDLSQALGVPGEVDHPLVVEKTKEIAKACMDHGIVVGNLTQAPDKAAFWAEQGLRYMAYGVDMGVMLSAFSNLVSNVHKECGIEG